MPSGKVNKPIGVSVCSTCKTCKWFESRNGSHVGVCMPDLPPMVRRSDNPAHYQVSEKYSCVLHTLKHNVITGQ